MTSVEFDGSALKSSVAFTGRLACMSRAEAFDVVRQHGGAPSPEVTKRTQVLIVGELGWPLLDDGRPSNKLSRATALGIPIVSERRFLEWVGKSPSDNDQKTYTADQLAALTKMSSGMIQELAQLSLLDERDGRFGFRDLASARQIAKLLNDGVRLSEIIRAVSAIRKWLPDVGLAAVRLHAGALSDVQVEQSGGRTDKYGQFVLAVDGAREDPDELFDRAHSAEQGGDIAEAERLYRLLMKSDPSDPAAAFNLGNLFGALPVRRSRPKPPTGLLSRPTDISPRPGTISPILLEVQGRAGARDRLFAACAGEAPTRTTLMRSSISRACCTGTASYSSMRPFTGAAISRSTTASEWAGAHARRALKFCEIQLTTLACASGTADLDKAA